MKGDEDQREQQPEKPKAAPKTRQLSGHQIQAHWQVDKKLPCPICKEWFSAKNYKRHGLRLHQMVRERLAQDEVVTVRKFR